MPLLASLLSWIVRLTAVRFAVKMIVSLGFGFITYAGADQLLNVAQDQVTTVYGQLPASAIQFLALLRFDFAISILFSALTFRVVFGFSKRFGPRLEQAG